MVQDIGNKVTEAKSLSEGLRRSLGSLYLCARITDPEYLGHSTLPHAMIELAGGENALVILKACP